jgi:hypothetical protein
LANFADAFADVLNALFIGVGLVVKGSEVLHEPDGGILLHDGDNGAVVVAVGWLNDPKFAPFEDMSFNFFTVCVWDFKLLNVNWFFCF